MASASADGLNIDEAVKKACEEPTLAKALAWIAIWESERVVRFVREHLNQPWDTCFKLCFERVLERYTITHGAIPAYDPTIEEKDPYEICAGECDAQADGIQETVDHDGVQGTSGTYSKMIGARDAYREMAEHLRALGRSRRAAASAPIRRVAVSYVERSDGRILCVWNRRSGGWSLPGGMVEDGETVEQAQERELREETGLETEYREPMFDGPVEKNDDAAGQEGRASRCHVFAVCAHGFWREREPGCPVTWLTRKEFLEWSKFAKYYARVFEACPPRPRVDERGDYSNPRVVPIEESGQLTTPSTNLSQRLDGHDWYPCCNIWWSTTATSIPRPGYGATLDGLCGKCRKRVGSADASANGRRATVAETEQEFLHLRPVSDDVLDGRSITAVCETHGWATDGMPRRLVEAMRRRHGHGGLNVCRECVDRAKSEADRERQSVTP